ncbi:MAG: hypothetical protein GY777_14640 [Candidatus Brocadiaceae bacterium]|nr:hypothetical protein [Candidatus Brocadiaceae bacterium]
MIFKAESRCSERHLVETRMSHFPALPFRLKKEPHVIGPLITDHTVLIRARVVVRIKAIVPEPSVTGSSLPETH